MINIREVFFVLCFAILLLSGCNGDDGSDGAQGPSGEDGADGAQSLITQTAVAAGSEACYQGGVRIDSGVDSDGDSALSNSEITTTSYLCNPTRVNESQNFNRIATFPVCLQLDANCNIDDETAAEIVAASEDGMTLIYTDSPAAAVGFVDISDPVSPVAAGRVVLDDGAEPTSVAVKGDYALVGVNTSADFVDVSGNLTVINIADQTRVTSIDLGGQPDSVAVSPDGNYAAVVIENERDEDLDDGAPPQLPAGSFAIVDISDASPANWSVSSVDLTELSDLYAADPEPEYVDINANNVAVITLQENNHMVLVNLADGSVINDFSAGDVDLTLVDLTEDALRIDQSESADDVLREPDGVAWINNSYFATADEGDLDGGSRGFTVFDLEGNVVWSAGNSLDHLTARLGHYPDARSANKGNEPENVEVGIFGADRYLFVNSERSCLVLVYDVADPTRPIYKQALPAAAAPEGVLAIPSRNLLVTASEEDSRDNKLRSSLNIYRYSSAASTYPTLHSADRDNGTPIPWSAMSGLAADRINADTLYAVEDSFFSKNRIFEIKLRENEPALLSDEITLLDSNDVFAGIAAVDLDDPTVAADDASRLEVFDEADLAAMINDDKTVNLDLEGIAQANDGGFWLVSEGSGTIGDVTRPINTLNFIFKTNAMGVIEAVIRLPDAINEIQLRFGFEGVAQSGDNIYVAFQRAWGAEANPRIGIYDTVAETWSFVFYPLDAPSSQNGGWVGLSEITTITDQEFLVVERDNQGGPDASIKRLYRINLDGVAADTTITKTLVRDLMDDLAAPGGLIYEKIEGFALTLEGDTYIINDNDGVDDNSGETQLIQLDLNLD